MNNHMKSVVLLIEDPQEGMVGIKFKSRDAAREWQDRHGSIDDTVRGVIRLVEGQDYFRSVYKHEPYVDDEPCLPPEGYTGPWAG